LPASAEERVEPLVALEAVGAVAAAQGVSFPISPKIRSVAARPLTVSSPARRRSVSARARAVRVSLLSVPLMVAMSRCPSKLLVGSAENRARVAPDAEADRGRA
jgi:hypothetical protein